MAGGRNAVWYTTEQPSKHTKVRTGCLTCKSRKIKCDETKPACHKCTTAKLLCRGYRPVNTWLFEGKSQQRSGEDPLTKFWIQPPSNTTPVDSRALQFYNERILPLLSGYSHQSLRAWTELFPQVYHCEPAIQHIILALSFGHKANTSEHSLDDAYLLDRASNHYSAAIKHLVISNEKPTMELMLIASYAFMMCDLFKSTKTGAQRCVTHVISGLNILDVIAKDHDSQPRSEVSRMQVAYIGPLLIHIKIFLTAMSVPRKFWVPDEPPDPTNKLRRPQLPSHLTDVYIGQDFCFQICRYMFLCIYDYRDINKAGQFPNISTRHSQDIQALFLVWYDLMVNLRSELSPDTNPLRHIATTMINQYERLLGAFHFLRFWPQFITSDRGKHITPYAIDLSNENEIVLCFPLNDYIWRLQRESNWDLSWALPVVGEHGPSLAPVIEAVPMNKDFPKAGGFFQIKLESCLKARLYTPGSTINSQSEKRGHILESSVSKVPLRRMRPKP